MDPDSDTQHWWKLIPGLNSRWNPCGGGSAILWCWWVARPTPPCGSERWRTRTRGPLPRWRKSCMRKSLSPWFKRSLYIRFAHVLAFFVAHGEGESFIIDICCEYGTVPFSSHVTSTSNQRVLFPLPTFFFLSLCACSTIRLRQFREFFSFFL
jgi:hypothetical protein